MTKRICWKDSCYCKKQTRMLGGLTNTPGQFRLLYIFVFPYYVWGKRKGRWGGGEQCFTKGTFFFFFFSLQMRKNTVKPHKTGQGVEFQQQPGFCTNGSSWSTACFLLLLETPHVYGENYIFSSDQLNLFFPSFSRGTLGDHWLLQTPEWCGTLWE